MINMKTQPIYLSLVIASFIGTGATKLADQTLTFDSVSFETRARWMRLANQALSDISESPCPFAAFGTVIVNHTDSPVGKLICMGVNENRKTGNPALHGEIAAITNCTDILTDSQGDFRLSTSEAQSAFSDLSLYTNAESCPMCASAIRWAGFREYIYGTSIARLTEVGWHQIQISSMEVFAASYDLPTRSRLIGNFLANETDPYFLWQFNPAYPCPKGCSRTRTGASCKAS
ncbi:FCY1p [Penicillium brasilianum]|uniref:FCY1p n=1 Tax=Penicillium brasilianum TaxID=104259 RepID=A0A1S9RPG4_PENBI|nr:FCY1p [Penicillium brasilianum]